MSFRSKLIIVFISVAISLYAMLPGILGNFFPTFAQQPINDAGAQIRIFESVLQHIQNDYVDEPNLEKVRSGALRGLAYGLDPYSSYLTAEQVKDFQNKKQNTLAGIGAEFSQVSGYLYVISVIKGSPAEKAGLKGGDVIEYIESKATRDISLYDARQLLFGENGSKIKLRVLRAGVRPQNIEVVRGSYKIPEAEIKVEDGKIGVVKVYSLEDGESNDIRNHVQQLTKQGVQKIILDLRGVSAGTINEAVAVANLFIKDGNLAQIIGRDNKILKNFPADASKFVFDGKMAVLIDISTAGPGEVLASAFVDRQRGDVVGERSFGAGTEQQLFALRGGDGLLLTTSKWASATGKPFLGEDRANSGVKPTVEVKRPDNSDSIDPEDLADQNENEPAEKPNQKEDSNKPAPEDVQLKKALELLQDKAMQKAA
ncbi:MAG TPA: S41 family peptidase [Pyrinomonadaceae bacterium]|nr:S41 family peptidase [Pyrinomonadaceae bacterium]